MTRTSCSRLDLLFLRLLHPTLPLLQVHRDCYCTLRGTGVPTHSPNAPAYAPRKLDVLHWARHNPVFLTRATHDLGILDRARHDPSIPIHAMHSC
jgi:hypothetical protein